MSLVVVGTVAFDAIETPNGKRDRVVGGSATYFSLSASHFYKNIKIVSIIGSDFDQDTLDALHERGVDTAGIDIREGEKSFFWSGRYHNDFNNRDTLATDLNVLLKFDPVLPESYTDAKYLMLANIDPVLQLKVLDQIKQRPDFIMLDTMNFWMDTALDPLLEVMKRVDILTINDEEARQLSGEFFLPKAAKKILAMGPKYLIIKRGEYGAMLFDNYRVYFAPALPMEEISDPTGAGDTFAGGFLGEIASTNDLSFEGMKRAIMKGTVMASFCVEDFGPENMLRLNKSGVDQRILEWKVLATPPS